jgi:hypothetical protein
MLKSIRSISLIISSPSDLFEKQALAEEVSLDVNIGRGGRHSFIIEI